MKSASILVVDDNEPTRRVLQLWLELNGYKVRTARSGHEAMRAFQADAVDLIITDILMPDGDGLELIRTLKKSHPDARFLAISGGGMDTTSSTCLQRAHAAGAQALLLKPFHQDQLREALDYVLGPHEHAETAAAGRAASAVRSSREFRMFSGVAAKAAARPVWSRETP